MLANTVFAQQLSELKTELESMIVREIARKLQASFNAPSPFDAIYISDLKPDKLNEADIFQLRRFARIVDLSDQLIFDDEPDE